MNIIVILITFGLFFATHGSEPIVQDNKNITKLNTYNSTDDYYYEINEAIDEGEPTFLDKWRTLYEQGKNVTVNKHVNHINETFNSLKIFKQNMEYLFKSSDDSREQQKLLEFLSEIDLGLTNDCLSSLTQVIEAIGRKEIWALKFLDSAGRLASGLAEGLVSDFGEYYECLDIISNKIDNSTPIKGQYCLANIVMPYPPIDSLNKSKDQLIFPQFLDPYGLKRLSTVGRTVQVLNLVKGKVYKMGICIPSQCSAQEVQSLLNTMLYPITRIPLEVEPECHLKDESTPLDKFQIISISILSTLFLLTVLSTAYEFQTKNNFNSNETKVESNGLLTSFSLIKNTRLLFAKSTKFAAIDAIRLFLVLQVHIVHVHIVSAYMSQITFKKIFSELFIKTFNDTMHVFVRNAMPLDAFFTLSGFLLSSSLLRRLDKTSGRFNYFEFVFQRWMRFTVLMFGSILFFYLFPLTGGGPFWDYGVYIVTPGCQMPKTLLKTLFLVHNYAEYDFDSMNTDCNAPSWYLAALFQLTIISPLFIVLYHKKQIYGLIALLVVIIISLFASIAPHVLFDVKPFIQLWDFENMREMVPKTMVWGHHMPNSYAAGFFIGIAYGYLMRKNIDISRSKSTLFWVLSIIFCISTYMWQVDHWRLDRPTNFIDVILWSSIGRAIFSIGLGWVYFACCTGRGGYFSRFLSWHGFQPIARLSFGIFILHFLVVMHRLFSIDYTYVLTDKYVFEHLVVDFIYDIILAFIFYVLIESPFNNLINYFIGLKNKSVDTSAQNKSQLSSKKEDCP